MPTIAIPCSSKPTKPAVFHNSCAVVLCIFLTVTSSAIAQVSPNPATAPDSQTSAINPNDPKAEAQKKAAAEKKAQEEELAIQKKEQSKRLLGTLPNFATTDRRDPPPLTPTQKFHLFAKSAFDPVEFFVVGMQAGFSQAEDEFPEYGVGAAGYGKRYGATFADEVSSGFFTDYFYPVIFKEDPRYFRLGEGSIKHRLLYAIKQDVVCHTDSGSRSVSWENIFGALTSGSVSNAYYPPSERGFGLTMSRSAISAGYGALGGIIDEFYPDISHALFHRHEPKTAADQP